MVLDWESYLNYKYNVEMISDFLSTLTLENKTKER